MQWDMLDKDRLWLRATRANSTNGAMRDYAVHRAIMQVTILLPSRAHSLTRVAKICINTASFVGCSILSSWFPAHRRRNLLQGIVNSDSQQPAPCCHPCA